MRGTAPEGDTAPEMNSSLPPKRPALYPAQRSDLARVSTGALVVIAFAVVLFLLVQARFMLISLATAIILFSLMSDAIDGIARLRVGPLHIPKWLASLVALALVSALLLTLSAIILSQVNEIVVTTIAYADQSQRAIAALFGWMGDGVERAVFESMQTIDVSAYVRTAAGQAGSLLSATILVIIFVTFLFVERIWFSTKLTAAFGDEARAIRVGRIIATIIHRVNRYLFVKTVVSAATGLMIYGVARLFSLDLAVALAILTFVLNFIPSVGSIIATVMVALVGYIQIGEPAQAAGIFVICGLIQFVTGNLIDPMLMGRALRLSSFGIIISLAFWGAVWGVPGMFLSVPIMVALMIICSEIPALRPLAVLLSREGLPEGPSEPGPSGGADEAPLPEARAS
jgi:AI-2 transport protein TqsA